MLSVRRLLIMVALLSMPLGLVMSETKEKQADSSSLPVRVAVMDFKNLSLNDDYNQSSATMSRLLNADLAGVSGVTALERERLGEILREIGLSDFSNAKSVSLAQKALGADFLLEGSLKLADTKLVFQYNLISLKDGKTALSGEAGGKPDELFSIEQKIFAEVKRTLNAPALVAEKAEAPKEIRLAIVPLENLSPGRRAGNVAEVLRYTIEAGLSNLPKVFLVARERLNEIAAEQKLALNGLSPANAVKVGKLVQADFLLLGDVTIVGEELRADLRIVKVATGKVVQVKTASGQVAELSAVNDKLCADILESLNFALALSEKETLRQANQASREAMHHFYEAIRLAKGNTGVVGSDEVQALQRVLYLDALDAGAETYLIDQLLESEMYSQAEQRIRKVLNLKLPSETRATLLHRLALTYTEKNQIPILWHIVKNFPNTPAATEAYWYLGNLYYNYPEFKNPLQARLCLEKVMEDTDTLRKMFPHYFEYRLDIVGTAKEMLGQTYNELGFGAFPFKRGVYNIYMINGRPFGKIYWPADNKDLINFVEKVTKRDWAAAFEIMQKSNRFGEKNNLFWNEGFCIVLLTAFKMTNQPKKALELLEWQKQDFLSFNPDLNKHIRYLGAICEKIAAVKKYPVCQGEEPKEAPLPSIPSDRIPAGLADWPSNFPPEAVTAIESSIDKYPDNPLLAFAMSNNTGLDSNNKMSAFLLVYAHRNQPEKAIFLFASHTAQINRHLIPKKEAFPNLPGQYAVNKSSKVTIACPFSLRLDAFIALIQCFLVRHEYGKAISCLKQLQDFESQFAVIRILVNKFGNYEEALKLLREHYGPNFGYIWEHGRPARRLNYSEQGHYLSISKSGRQPSRASKALSDDIDFWAAKCFEGLGDFEKAYIEYGRLLRYPDYIERPENGVEARARMLYLEKLLLEKQKQPLWEIGDWWEGTQGWYLTSPANKNLPDGWVFTDLYFEVSDIVKNGVFDCYSLDIYPMKREELFELTRNDPVEKAAQRFATVFITTLTNTPCDIQPGKAWRMEPTFYFLQDMPWPIMAHWQTLCFGYFTIVPFVENKHLPPAAFLFFTEPFNAMMPIRIFNTTKYDDQTLRVNGKNLPCRRGTTAWDFNFELLSYAEMDSNAVERTIRSEAVKGQVCEGIREIKLASPHREQIWSREHGWWLRDVEFNPWYVKGKSPETAKYSKLFVLTCHNGEKMSVDTGLPGADSDISVLRANHKAFDKKCPYDSYPSRETAQMLNFMLVTECPPYTREIIRRGRMALQYIKDQNKEEYVNAIEAYLKTGKFKPYDQGDRPQTIFRKKLKISTEAGKECPKMIKYPSEDNPAFLNRPQ